MNNHFEFKSRFLVKDKDCFIPLLVDDIAYFFVEEKVTFCMTFQSKKHIINDSLESLSKFLNPKHFFRVNRQYIISFQTIVRIQTHFNYTSKIIVFPPREKEILISKNKIQHFKKWANQ